MLDHSFLYFSNSYSEKGGVRSRTDAHVFGKSGMPCILDLRVPVPGYR